MDLLVIIFIIYNYDKNTFMSNMSKKINYHSFKI